ncbi:hypothetical protein LTR27_012984 [Elasticomyces elasticus]|nr:hypothetical protein LTR27_012984 [Elasticomyces elasticus]
MSSAQAVFGIPELFDIITLELEPKQLFVNLRVCRTWREYITRSTKLQTHMFLRSGPAATEAKDVKLNPWLGDLLKSISYAGLATHEYYKILSHSIWAKPDCSLRKTLLLQRGVKSSRLAMWIRICSEAKRDAIYTGTRGYGENSSSVTLENVAEAMMEVLGECEGIRDGRLCNVSVYSTRIYGDGIWRGDVKIRSDEEKLRGRWCGYEGILPKGGLPYLPNELRVRPRKPRPRRQVAGGV